MEIFNKQWKTPTSNILWEKNNDNHKVLQQIIKKKTPLLENFDLLHRRLLVNFAPRLFLLAVFVLAFLNSPLFLVLLVVVVVGDVIVDAVVVVAVVFCGCCAGSC